MKKSYIYLIIILALLSIGIGYYLYKTNSNKASNTEQYNSTKISSTNNETENSTQIDNSAPETNTSSEENTSNNNAVEPETKLADYTTKIYTKDSERQNNISISCSYLNGTTINPGETFSFCSTVGKATSAKGYQKADVFQDGEKIQALGGGNCQVSSTLYNAVLKVPDLDVTERHEHSNSVPYVPKGKDAAVSYR